MINRVLFRAASLARRVFSHSPQGQRSSSVLAGRVGNNFLNDLGFTVSTENRKLLDKAFKAVYNLSFTALSGNTWNILQEKFVYRLFTFHKNKKKYANLYISPESFFSYYSTTILGLHCCISPILQQIKKQFPTHVPKYVFTIFFYVMAQLKKDTFSINDILIIKDFPTRDISCIQSIFDIVIHTLIKQQYIKSIQHKETGVLYKDPEKMLNYFKQTLTTFKKPETYRMPLLLIESY